MEIFFSVGEPSGDLHGANLISRLRAHEPQLQAVGFGGPRMAAAGCQLHEDLTKLAVMWIGRVLLNLHKFWNLAGQADRYFQHHRPDAVVLIDYPGFNWWIARRAKAHGIPVFYYGTPQMWAWAGWRVKKMRRLVDHVLCKLPFEPDWYRQRGCNATFVGHPYFDHLTREDFDEAFLARVTGQPGPLVTILPGSRTQEVTSNLKWFLKAARIVHQQVPTARFSIAMFKESQVHLAQSQIATGGFTDDFPVDIFVGRTPELIHASHCTMACSGSVSLELLYHEKPTVILYWVKRWFYGFLLICKPLLQVRAKYITLVNMLADEPLTRRPRPYDPDAPGALQIPFPEFFTCQDKSRQIAEYVVRWLTDQIEYQRRRDQLRELREKIAHGGASDRTARYLLDKLAERPPVVPRPHFLPSRTAGRTEEPVVVASSGNR